MPLSLLNHSALALFAQRTRIPTSARSLASVPFGFVLVRVRVRRSHKIEMASSPINLISEVLDLSG
jgi:hypothetical protein